MSTASLGLPAAPELPKIADVAKLPELPKLAASVGHADATPTETYAQIARGATSCWFGAGGVLKKTHIFYADADPPSSGGKAEIAILEKDPTAPSMRGNKVYRVSLSPEGAGTRIELTNHKLAENVVGALATDVHRFAAGDLACAQYGASAPVLEPIPVAQSVPKSKKQQTSKRSGRSGG